MDEIQEEKGYSRWEWVFYMVIIPALFAALLGGVLLSLLGINVVGKVMDWANTIPYVEKLIPDKESSQATAASKGGEAKQQPQQLSAEQQLAKQQQTVTTLQTETKQKDQTIQGLQQQVQDLQKMMEDKKTTEEERQKQYQDLAKLYTSMAPKSAAAIISNLPLEESVTVLTKMNAQQRADILAKMDPKQAADLSVLLKDTVVNKDDDIAALQERVKVLTKALSETRQDSTSLDSLINTFSQMPADTAASVISSLMNTNQSRAVSLMAGLSSDKRAAILSALAKTNEPMASRITSELLR
ncbi:MotE family protein [Brevibacillus fulvus]|uniref:Flagellar motility protein MotE (MotC chaperone) n=1 Tax=Brevibacillus fulvus TaxID=1125967 RepID=A0A938Y1D0_9BACL|nr:hypothetical protein [Brevibacillus fulvus]MBM7590624.1 flagellar motility protein MotE (MotC chaperone) [Brevibacillus fulvus]